MGASIDLVLRLACDCCGSPSELYGTNCKHSTLCLSCGKAMAAACSKCQICGQTLTSLIREYNVRASTSTDKVFSIGRFVTGIPPFPKKKNAENKWSLHKEGVQGRQVTDGLREKYKSKPWILEDETGQYQYQGQQLEGGQTTTYYLLMMQGKEFVAVPAESWYNFHKVAQYKQLTLEEAEEKMKKRKNNASGYERWMMKAAANGPAAFGDMKNNEGLSNGAANASRHKKGKSNDDGDHSDQGEEDREQEEARKNRLAFNKKGMGDDDEEEKGDDWEHEEVFTDDDEAIGNDLDEREEFGPEIPAPPEIKQDDVDEDEEERLSKSGKELKELLGRTAGTNESDADDEDDDDDDDDDDNDDDVDDEVAMSPVLTPTHKDVPKREPADSSPSNAAPSGSSRVISSTCKSSRAKRKVGADDAKIANGAPSKKMKIDNQLESASIKEELPSSKSSVPPKSSSLSSMRTASTSPSVSPITEDEIRSVLLSVAPVTTQDIVAKFKQRLKSQEEKSAFADILRRISKIQKRNDHSYIVLRS